MNSTAPILSMMNGKVFKKKISFKKFLLSLPHFESSLHSWSLCSLAIFCQQSLFEFEFQCSFLGPFLDQNMSGFYSLLGFPNLSRIPSSIRICLQYEFESLSTLVSLCYSAKFVFSLFCYSANFVFSLLCYSAICLFNNSLFIFSKEKEIKKIDQDSIWSISLKICWQLSVFVGNPDFHFISLFAISLRGFVITKIWFYSRLKICWQLLFVGNSGFDFVSSLAISLRFKHIYVQFPNFLLISINC